MLRIKIYGTKERAESMNKPLTVSLLSLATQFALAESEIRWQDWSVDGTDKLTDLKPKSETLIGLNH